MNDIGFLLCESIIINCVSSRANLFNAGYKFIPYHKSTLVNLLREGTFYVEENKIDLAEFKLKIYKFPVVNMENDDDNVSETETSADTHESKANTLENKAETNNETALDTQQQDENVSREKSLKLV